MIGSDHPEAARVVASQVEPVPEDELARVAWANKEQIIMAKEHIHRGAAWLAERLVENEDRQFYRALGYPTFEAFLADPEIAIGRTTAYNLMGIWRDLVQQRGLPAEIFVEVGAEKLGIVRPAIAAGGDPEEWLATARENPKRALRKLVREAIGADPPAPSDVAAREDRQRERDLQEALSGATVDKVEWSRWQGLRLQLVTEDGRRVAVRCFEPDGDVRLEVTWE